MIHCVRILSFMMCVSISLLSMEENGDWKTNLQKKLLPSGEYQSFNLLAEHAPFESDLMDAVRKGDKEACRRILISARLTNSAIKPLCQVGLNALEPQHTPQGDGKKVPYSYMIAYPMAGFVSALSTIKEMYDFTELASDATVLDYFQLVANLPGLFVFAPYSIYWARRAWQRRKIYNIHEHNRTQEEIRKLLHEFRN